MTGNGLGMKFPRIPVTFPGKPQNSPILGRTDRNRPSKFRMSLLSSLRQGISGGGKDAGPTSFEAKLNGDRHAVFPLYLEDVDGSGFALYR